MAALDEALSELRDANTALEEAETDRRGAMARRDEALRRAHRAGATYVVIQAETGLSNATVTKALRRE